MKNPGLSYSEYDMLTMTEGNATRRVFHAAVSDKSNLTLLHYINMVLSSEKLVSEVALRSYKHQLGFMKYVLLVDGEGRSLRIHHWDTVDSGRQEDIHSHCAEFVSRVIHGALTENSFVSVQGNSYARFRYRFDHILNRSVAEPDGQSEAILRTSQPLQAGDIYHRAPSDLHNVSRVAQGTLTVSAWNQRNHDALVLKNPGARSEDCCTQLGIPSEKLREGLMKIKERMLSQ